MSDSIFDSAKFRADHPHANSHAIYKYQQSSLRPARRASFSAPLPRRDTSIDPSLAHIHEPGGFRRQFIINSARERGQEAPRVLRSFVDFLYLYGHFVSSSVQSPKIIPNDLGLLRQEKISTRTKTRNQKTKDKANPTPRPTEMLEAWYDVRSRVGPRLCHSTWQTSVLHCLVKVAVPIARHASEGETCKGMRR